MQGQASGGYCEGERDRCSVLGAAVPGGLGGIAQLCLSAPMRELPLKDVFLTVQNCNYTLSTQFHHLREDVTIMLQDMQKVREHTSALENWVTIIEKYTGLMQHDLKAGGS